MESNKDEAFRCIALARQALNDGNADKAERLLCKSMRLYPNSTAESLLNTLKSFRGSPGSSSDSDLRRRQKPATRRSANSEPALKQNQGTGAQRALVQQILREVKGNYNYYKILGVEKSASAKEIKMCYRKLALKLHPDKNPASGADEAFKAVTEAWEVLKDESKRSTYDLCGRRGTQQSIPHRGYNRGRHGGAYYTTSGFDDGLSPEELFHMFFNGGAGGAQFRQRTRYARSPPNRRRSSEDPPSCLKLLMQFIPVVLLMFLMSGFLFGGSSVNYDQYGYSYQRSNRYHLAKTTSSGTPFYVSTEFERNMKEWSPSRLKKFEIETLDRPMVWSLHERCQQQLEKKRYEIGKLRFSSWFYDTEKQIEQIQAEIPQSCQQLKEFFLENQSHGINRAYYEVFRHYRWSRE